MVLYPAVGAIAVDFDLDLDRNVLACSYALNQVVYFENDESQAFTMHAISAPVQHPLTLACDDIDQDNDLDILGNNFMATGGLLW